MNDTHTHPVYLAKQMTPAQSIPKKLKSAARNKRGVSFTYEEVQALVSRGKLREVVKWEAEEIEKAIKEDDSDYGLVPIVDAGASVGTNERRIPQLVTPSVAPGVSEPAFGVID